MTSQERIVEIGSEYGGLIWYVDKKEAMNISLSNEIK